MFVISCSSCFSSVGGRASKFGTSLHAVAAVVESVCWKTTQPASEPVRQDFLTAELSELCARKRVRTQIQIVQAGAGT